MSGFFLDPNVLARATCLRRALLALFEKCRRYRVMSEFEGKAENICSYSVLPSLTQNGPPERHRNRMPFAFKPYCSNPNLDSVLNLRISPLRTAIILLLATVPWSVSAQTAQSEKLQQVISDLRTCVRTYAPAAQAAGVQNTNAAVNFFDKTCLTDFSRPLSDRAPSNLGAVPPGIFRLAIGEEWAAFIKQAGTR
jgi:hypothetical protein